LTPSLPKKFGSIILICGMSYHPRLPACNDGSQNDAYNKKNTIFLLDLRIMRLDPGHLAVELFNMLNSIQWQSNVMRNSFWTCSFTATLFQ
jgi:hypothetical protein